MTTDEKLSLILTKLETIELKVSIGDSATVAPVSSFFPGGKDWRLRASDEEVREYNRKKGVARRKGCPSQKG